MVDSRYSVHQIKLDKGAKKIRAPLCIREYPFLPYPGENNMLYDYSVSTPKKESLKR